MPEEARQAVRGLRRFSELKSAERPPAETRPPERPVTERQPSERRPPERQPLEQKTLERTLPPVREAEPPSREKEDVPFYRKAFAQSLPEDPNGYGPNWSNVDDYDIPTVLRKQMD